MGRQKATYTHFESTIRSPLKPRVLLHTCPGREIDYYLFFFSGVFCVTYLPTEACGVGTREQQVTAQGFPPGVHLLSALLLYPIPIPYHTILSHSILSHFILSSHPVTSHPVQLHPFPSHLIPEALGTRRVWIGPV